MKPRLYVMVPRLDNTGAIKGAVALCNGLVDHFSLSLICLKGVVSRAGLKPGIPVISLEAKKSFRSKYNVIKKILSSETRKPFVISFCFSADLMNFFLRSKANTIASLRGNLLTAYRKNYGLSGVLMAFLHYWMLCRFNRILVLSESMKEQALRLKLRKISVVGNFVDEPQLEEARLARWGGTNGKRMILFIGNFSKRKRADLMVQAAKLLREQNIDFQMIMLGDGPMRKTVENLVTQNKLDQEIQFLGHVQDPYPIVQQADLMVLPSESEGIPRAALESLFFGVPCLLRNADANPELIKPGMNGYLFDSDLELGNAIATALLKDSLKSNKCLIPPAFRYKENITKMIAILKNERPY